VERWLRECLAIGLIEYLLKRPSRFSAGKHTALVIDVGASMVAVTPVIDGMIVKKGKILSARWVD